MPGLCYLAPLLSSTPIMHPQIFPLSETAITIEWGNRMDENVHQQVLHLDYLIRQKPFPGFVETVPAYTTLTIFYQPELLAIAHNGPFVWIKNHVEKFMRKVSGILPVTKNVVSIPVCYDEVFGYDLDAVAAARGISKETLIALHQQKEYNVYMMGFLPGFAYMGALDDAIATPRKPTPRALVEAGSVGIAGHQTGIYPLPSPGGWQIIGRTPCNLFDSAKTNPFLLKTGDTVQFYAISKEAFYQIKNAEKEASPPAQRDGTADAVAIKAGIYSTIQDNGRPGLRAYGVPVGGAMDTVAHQVANALVGNAPNAATIECTMGGLALQFNTATEIALTGGGTASINGQKVLLYQRHTVRKNDLLEIKFTPPGLRTYLAVRGGFASENIMGSKSMSQIVGIGSPLKKDAGLWFDRDFYTETTKTADNFTLSTIDRPTMIRVFQGPEYHRMTTESSRQFYSQPFILSNRCDRMGYHLQAEPLSLDNSGEMLSTAVTKGTIQLTPNGQLILLMSDCQTTGGYPRVGQVAAVDLPLAAQLIPGETISFKSISFAEAETLYIQQQQMIHALFS